MPHLAVDDWDDKRKNQELYMGYMEYEGVMETSIKMDDLGVPRF